MDWDCLSSGLANDDVAYFNLMRNSATIDFSNQEELEPERGEAGG